MAIALEKPSAIKLTIKNAIAPSIIWKSIRLIMAAKDLFHNAVKQALISDRWIITADPLIVKIEGVKLEIDLAAEKVIAAEKAGRKIAIEIKSFLKPSTITDFHSALGQFLNYRLALQMREPDRTLYLAVPLDTFESFFQEPFIQAAVKSYQVKLTPCATFLNFQQEISPTAMRD
jgi:hypothetical protein